MSSEAVGVCSKPITLDSFGANTKVPGNKTINELKHLQRNNKKTTDCGIFNDMV